MVAVPISPIHVHSAHKQGMYSAGAVFNVIHLHHTINHATLMVYDKTRLQGFVAYFKT